MKDIRILLCEDDPSLGRLLSDYLKAKGFEVTWAQDGVEGLKAFHRDTYDFIVLDVMMPRKDGFQVAEEIRLESRSIPILFLTARSTKDDTLEGFKAGADDYMTKPFSMEELVLRIQAILRRTAALPEVGEEVTQFSVGLYAFDYTTQSLTLNGEAHRLTTKENELLFMLCKHKNALLERAHALRNIWGDANYFNGRSMDVYIAKLRKHLKGDDRIEILNVHGKGFKLVAPTD
ncbi:MAG TPA: DNA-binding response regulator [Flavobacteriales bacterium]|nr:DNA-binding response regulator [Flavobacteriales bacterium]|tara:strand:- start:5661 stop:6359 length:699 start_codon:yes stop_codon:yes gene_type:complete